MTPTIAVIQLPGSFDFTAVKQLVLDSVSSENSKRVYGQNLDAFWSWYQTGPGGPISKAIVNAFKSFLEAKGLAPSSINVALSAIRKLCQEAADNGLLAPELSAGVMRIKGVARHGRRMGNWLTPAQAEALLAAPDANTLKGKRDRAILALMLGCGLRRAEIANLQCAALQPREGRWVLLDIVGKGRRIRTCVLPPWAFTRVQKWLIDAGLRGMDLTGKMFCSMHRWDRLTGDPLDPESIRTLVQDYAASIGCAGIAPHDLRRTFAKLAFTGRADLSQIQIALGHSSVQTTERYLGTEMNLHDAPCDHLNLRVSI
jgi:site-specific recombinase XerD